MFNETFKFKAIINLGVALLSLFIMGISIFTRLEIYKDFEATFSGIWLGLVLINGLEWWRLELERKNGNV